MVNINKEKFEKFEKIRKSGKYNMYDQMAIKSSGLIKEEYLDIIKNYEKYYEKYESDAKYGTYNAKYEFLLKVRKLLNSNGIQMRIYEGDYDIPYSVAYDKKTNKYRNIIMCSRDYLCGANVDTSGMTKVQEIKMVKLLLNANVILELETNFFSEDDNCSDGFYISPKNWLY